MNEDNNSKRNTAITLIIIAILVILALFALGSYLADQTTDQLENNNQSSISQ